MFNKSFIPLSIREWFANTDLVSRFREQVDHMAVHTCINTLKDARRPNPKVVSTAGEVNNNALCFYAGYCQALEDFQKMGKQNPNLARTHTVLTSWEISDDK